MDEIHPVPCRLCAHHMSGFFSFSTPQTSNNRLHNVHEESYTQIRSDDIEIKRSFETRQIENKINESECVCVYFDVKEKRR